jgi:hypothetical protein
MPYCRENIEGDDYACDSYTELECKICNGNYCEYHLNNMEICEYCIDCIKDENDVLYNKIVNEIKNNGGSLELKNILAIMRMQLNVNKNVNDDNKDDEDDDE